MLALLSKCKFSAKDTRLNLQAGVFICKKRDNRPIAYLFKLFLFKNFLKNALNLSINLENKRTFFKATQTNNEKN